MAIKENDYYELNKYLEKAENRLAIEKHKNKVGEKYKKYIGKFIISNARKEYKNRLGIVLSVRSYFENYPFKVLFVDNGQIIDGIPIWNFTIFNWDEVIM